MHYKQIILIICLLLLGNQFVLASGATNFYLHDHEQYWWYHSKDPHFYAVVPNDAERYTLRKLFGNEVVEIALDENHSTIMEISSFKDKEVSAVVDFVSKKWTSMIDEPVILANREITTSNGLKCFFYAIEGIGTDGDKGMLRSVFFKNGDAVAYLAMFLKSSDYRDDLRNHWIKAVNEFEW